MSKKALAFLTGISLTSKRKPIVDVALDDASTSLQQSNPAYFHSTIHSHALQNNTATNVNVDPNHAVISSITIGHAPASSSSSFASAPNGNTNAALSGTSSTLLPHHFDDRGRPSSRHIKPYDIARLHPNRTRTRYAVVGSRADPMLMCMCSYVPYVPDEKKEKQPFLVDMIARQRRGKEEISFARYLEDDEGNSITSHSSSSGYNPMFLDDPSIRTLQTRRVLHLQSYLSTILPFITPKALREELNAQFRRRHAEWLPDNLGITLSKIRRLKHDMWRVCSLCGIDPSTLAFAYVFFEKCVLRLYVSKANRRIVAAVCLFVATKWEDPRFSDRSFLRFLTATCEDVFGVSRKKILEAEFDVFADGLHFEMHVPTDVLEVHYRRILQQFNIPPPDA